jgi:hypothetical protein
MGELILKRCFISRVGGVWTSEFEMGLFYWNEFRGGRCLVMCVIHDRVGIRNSKSGRRL